MKILNLSLPHPVLGLSDDVSGEYTPKVEAAPTEELFIFKIDHLLENKTLQELVNAGKAQFCVEVNCPATIYRKSYLSSEFSQEIKIKQEFLRNRFDLTFYIVAGSQLSHYSNDGFNYDYEGSDFDLDKGDILAFGGEIKQFAVKDWSSLKSIKSFMSIKKDPDSDGNMSFQLSPDKIIVLVSETDYEKYRELINTENISPVFHTSIVLPALIYALNQMADVTKGDNYSSDAWCEYLKLRKENDTDLQKLDWSDPDQIIKIAQLILDKPFSRMLQAIETQNKGIEEIIED